MSIPVAVDNKRASALTNKYCEPLLGTPVRESPLKQSRLEENSSMDGLPGQAGAEFAGGSGGGLSSETGLGEAAAGVAAGGVSGGTCPAGGAGVGMVEAGGGKGTADAHFGAMFPEGKGAWAGGAGGAQFPGHEYEIPPFPDAATSAHPVLNNQWGYKGMPAMYGPYPGKGDASPFFIDGYHDRGERCKCEYQPEIP